MAISVDLSIKPFRPGIGGWTVSELDTPEVEALWAEGRYELVEGVITEMPPPNFDGARSTSGLTYQLEKHFELAGLNMETAAECDLVLDEDRISRADLVAMTEEQVRRSRELSAARYPDSRGQRVRIMVPPALVVEVISRGHESRDRRIKRRWYAEFGVTHYWIVDPNLKVVEALQLVGDGYQQLSVARGSEVMELPLFGGIRIDLGRVWSRF